MPRTRHRFIFSGRVQGVGFRFTTQRVAASHPVTGYVRNLPDGTVELVAEGEFEAIQKFISAVRASIGRRIQNMSQWAEETQDPPFEGFFIRHD